MMTFDDIAASRASLARRSRVMATMLTYSDEDKPSTVKCVTFPGVPLIDADRINVAGHCGKPTRTRAMSAARAEG